ncbi:SDR family oxidoreductase, partial [Streptomyces sp. SID7982]|nr:SDR family oxidoreductase [Streptomyces sp. SID7982]
SGRLAAGCRGGVGRGSLRWERGGRGRDSGADRRRRWATAPEAVAALESITALGRMGQPEDVADVVGFLAGPQGHWVTGQTIDVSGGTCLGPLIPE